MVLDNEKQRGILIGVLTDFQVTGNFQQIKEAVLNLSEVIAAVQNAKIEDQAK